MVELGGTAILLMLSKLVACNVLIRVLNALQLHFNGLM